MIELPEAIVIARQISAELKGKLIREGMRGNTPHKFAFYSSSAEEYATILPGKRMGEADANGPLILISLEPEYVLMLGGGGERILYHKGKSTLPKKHHLLLHFEDDSYLTVTVQGWGSAQLLHETEVAPHPFISKNPSPLSDQFTLDYFLRLFDGLVAGDKRAIKFFCISKPGILGVGNGYLQDILFSAKIHPRRRAIETTLEERRALFDATRDTLKEAIRLNGRDTERDLYDRPGGYVRILDSRVVGKPCPRCGTPIEKIFFLGGASYFCPNCQV